MNELSMFYGDRLTKDLLNSYTQVEIEERYLSTSRTAFSGWSYSNKVILGCEFPVRIIETRFPC